jgi:hypothetical protein
MAKFAVGQKVRFVKDIIDSQNGFVYARKDEEATVKPHYGAALCDYCLATADRVFWCSGDEIEAVEV